MRRAVAVHEWLTDPGKMDEGIGGKRQTNPRERANIFSIITFLWVLLPLLCLQFSNLGGHFQLYLWYFQKRNQERADWRGYLRYSKGLPFEEVGWSTGSRMGERKKEKKRSFGVLDNDEVLWKDLHQLRCFAASNENDTHVSTCIFRPLIQLCC